jgi:transcriptional regulator with XRE-family HTH domain
MEHKNNLKAVRKSCKMTGEQLAEKSGYDVSLISRWESGKRRLNQDNIQRLAAALNCPAWEIVPDLLKEHDEADLQAKGLSEQSFKALEDFYNHLLEKEKK